MMTGVTIINVIDKPFSLDACIGLCAIFIGCAICEYALNETEPKKTLSPTASVAFSLIRPTLDSGRKKAANRQNKTTSSEQQTKNKTKTKQEQTAKENEREKERENECSLSLPAPPPRSAG